jgi:hypothetical protein
VYPRQERGEFFKKCTKLDLKRIRISYVSNLSAAFPTAKQASSYYHSTSTIGHHGLCLLLRYQAQNQVFFYINHPVPPCRVTAGGYEVKQLRTGDTHTHRVTILIYWIIFNATRLLADLAAA